MRGGGRGLPSWGEEQRPPPYLARAGASTGSGLGRGGGEGWRGGAGLGPLGGPRMRRPVSFLLLRRVPTSPSGTSPPTAWKGAPEAILQDIGVPDRKRWECGASTKEECLCLLFKVTPFLLQYL